MEQCLEMKFLIFVFWECLLRDLTIQQRILNVRYYSLLPNVNVKNNLFEEKQWEAILRSIAFYKSFMWKNQNKISVEVYIRFFNF